MTALPARRFRLFAWLVLLYNVPVILWGAYVRISFSGDGCGADWPFCAGHALPANMARPMAIEFTHRMMTSLDLLLTAALVIWAFRRFPKAHAVRRYASWSAFFLFVEAILGAGLVLLRKVAHDQSAGRAVYLSAHLTNTMLLLGALTITAWLASRSSAKATAGPAPASRIPWRRLSPLVVISCLVALVVSITGALAALGDTLFPVSSLAAGMQQDFAAGSNLLLRLRLFHPATAIAGAIVLLYAAISVMRRHPDGPVRTAAVRVLIITVLQLTIGAANLTLLAPVWMQMLHLLMADTVWVCMVVFALETITEQVASQPTASILSAPAALLHQQRT